MCVCVCVWTWAGLFPELQGSVSSVSSGRDRGGKKGLTLTHSQPRAVWDNWIVIISNPHRAVYFLP